MRRPRRPRRRPRRTHDGPPEAAALPGRARQVTVRHDPGSSPCSRRATIHLVRAVEVTPLGHGLLVDSLVNPGSEPLLLGLGLEASTARFLDPTRLLAFDARAGIAALLSLDGVEGACACRVPPVTTGDGAALVTLDPKGRLTALDPATLGVRWSLPAPRPSPAASDSALRPGPGSRVVVAHDAGAIVVDVARADGPLVARASDPVVSPGGRYVGEVVPAEDEAAAPAWLVSITDTAGGAVVLSARAPGTVVTVGTPPLAFSRDERTAAYSVDASVVHSPSTSPRAASRRSVPGARHGPRWPSTSPTPSRSAPTGASCAATSRAPSARRRPAAAGSSRSSPPRGRARGGATASSRPTWPCASRRRRSSSAAAAGCSRTRTRRASPSATTPSPRIVAGWPSRRRACGPRTACPVDRHRAEPLRSAPRRRGAKVPPLATRGGTCSPPSSRPGAGGSRSTWPDAR
ncbi:MAG: hypothetical protein MZU84_00890 [Sphingobacterium sp.]|nr:hypothetical protein [Sphingobacterium sp.]